MSSGERKLDRRDRALHQAARRLRLLKIEMHRVKAELARLEADYEDQVADRLSFGLRRRPAELKVMRADAASASVPSRPHIELNRSHPGSSAKFDDPRPTEHHAAAGDLAAKRELRSARMSQKSPQIPAVDLGSAAKPTERFHRRKSQRQATRPLLMSFGLHAIIFLVCLPLGYATLSQDNFFLLASPPETFEETTTELTNIEIEATPANDAELQNVVLDQPEFNLTDSLLDDVTPMDSVATTQDSAAYGQTESMPGDLGTLMAGAGEPDGGKAGGPPGSAVFFGARSLGDRFVFLVDNSSSMKNGRLEGAIRELVASVAAMSPRQSFYVMFVSDQTYPMFYPEPAPALVPATDENKKRLGEWLGRVRLASGKNREIVKAMDLAASLQPHAVFFLWDGRIDDAGVRNDVLTHLTRPNNWTFTIHTLGLGIESLDSEHNLNAIAQAHGGTFQRVDLPPQKPR